LCSRPGIPRSEFARRRAAIVKIKQFSSTWSNIFAEINLRYQVLVVYRSQAVARYFRGDETAGEQLEF